MRIKELAALIPQEYRKEILDLDMIESASATAESSNMHYLIVVWQNYIEKDFQPDCNLCLGRVLDSFKQMKKSLIELEREYQLLKSL